LTLAAAVLAWLGGALVVLSDGGRGLALSLAMTGVALGWLVWATHDPLGGAVLIAGGIVAAGLRLRGRPDRWGLMEPGSTPRIVLTLVVALFALWIAVSVAAGDRAALTFAILAVIALAGARLLQAREPSAALAGAVCLALALGAAAGITDDNPGPAPYVIAAAIAVLASWFAPAERVGA
jgi:hypothetical protein